MIELYWQFFLAGLAIYALIKLIYFSIYSNGCNKIDNEKHEKFVNSIIKENRDEIMFSDDSDVDEEYNHAAESINYVELNYNKLTQDEELQKSEEFYNLMEKRRSVMFFSKDDVPLEVMKNVIKTAGTAPSIGHTEPWTYVLIKTQMIKEKVREIIEKNNTFLKKGKNYDNLEVDVKKVHLTDAPYLIMVFAQNIIGFKNDNSYFNYYSGYSTPLSVGILLAALQYAGLVSLVSTPTNCTEQFSQLLNRPSNEKFILLLSVGYPQENCKVPDLKRKNTEDICLII